MSEFIYKQIYYKDPFSVRNGFEYNLVCSWGFGREYNSLKHDIIKIIFY